MLQVNQTLSYFLTVLEVTGFLIFRSDELQVT